MYLQKYLFVHLFGSVQWEYFFGPIKVHYLGCFKGAMCKIFAICNMTSITMFSVVYRELSKP